MLDARGREIDYMRISVTDRCNLRCIYCMPQEGIQMARHEDILSFEEIKRICSIVTCLGIKHIKITGGEPLVRKGIVDLIREIKAIPGITKVTLTTNGVLLNEMAEELHRSGIDGINISLDSTNDSIYETITRKNVLFDVKKGLEKILAYSDIPVKINSVIFQENQTEVIKLAELAKDTDLAVRFIEMMPIGYGKNFSFVGEEEVKKIIEEQFGKLNICDEVIGYGPGHYYTVDGFVGKIGFVSAMSHQFCGSCNRVRLTAQGFLKSCLQYHIGVDLREFMRKGATDYEIMALIEKTIMDKPEGHRFMESITDYEEHDSMVQIGG